MLFEPGNPGLCDYYCYVKNWLTSERSLAPLLWVGAGCSVANGYPAGAALARVFYKGLPDRLKEEVPSDNYKLVMDKYISQGPGKGQFVRELNGEMTKANEKPGGMHENMLRLPWFHLITTNYNPLLENAMQEVSGFQRVRILDSNQAIDPSAECHIFKIHGSRHEWEKMIFSKESYRMYERRYGFLQKGITGMLAQHPILFAGCSMMDTRLDKVLKKLPPGTSAGAYIMHKDEFTAFPQKRFDLLREKYNIKPIVVVSFADIPLFFEGLVKEPDILIKGPPQIKLLHLPASPGDTIHYELEQETLLDTFQPFTRKGEFYAEMPDPAEATLTELDWRLKNEEYDIVILSCHGSKEGLLVPEDEEGAPCPVSGEKLVESLTAFQVKPKVLILSACHSGGEPRETGHLSPAEEISRTGYIPCVIGMSKEISRMAAMDFNRGFMGALLEGKRLEEAFDLAGEEIRLGELARRQNSGGREPLRNEQEIPRLFMTEKGKNITRKDFSAKRLKAVGFNSMDFSGEYLSRGFIGRRRDIREIQKSIEPAGVILIKGPGGIGKSALAARVCSSRLRKGAVLVDHVGSVKLEGLLKKLTQQAEDEGLPLSAALKEGALNWEDHARGIIREYLLKRPVLLLLDNFEDNQQGGGKIGEEELARFITLCAKKLQNSGSCLLITSRYKVGGAQKTLDLSEMNRVEQGKLLFHLPVLSRLSPVDFKTLRQQAGGSPRALKLLEPMAAEELGDREASWEELSPLVEEVKELMTGEHNEEDFAPMALKKLIAFYNKDELDLLQKTALYRIPIEKAALEALELKNLRQNRQKPAALSLLHYLAGGTYYIHRLIADYILQNNPHEELPELHNKAAGYMEKVNSFEAVYHYRAARAEDKEEALKGLQQN